MPLHFDRFHLPLQKAEQHQNSYSFFLSFYFSSLAIVSINSNIYINIFSTLSPSQQKHNLSTSHLNLRNTQPCHQRPRATLLQILNSTWVARRLITISTTSTSTISISSSLYMPRLVISPETQQNCQQPLYSLSKHDLDEASTSISFLRGSIFQETRNIGTTGLICANVWTCLEQIYEYLTCSNWKPS